MKSPDPRSSFWKALRITYKSARRIVIGVVGVSIILVGIAMLVLPGPAFVVIPTGLAILGAEFAFARRWLRMIRIQARNGLKTIGAAKKSAGKVVRRTASSSASNGALNGHQPPSFKDPSAFDPADQEPHTRRADS